MEELLKQFLIAIISGGVGGTLVGLWTQRNLIRFKKYYSKRAEIIGNLYSKLVVVSGAIRGLKYGDGKLTGYGINYSKVETLVPKIISVIDYFEKNRIYLDPKTCEIIIFLNDNFITLLGNQINVENDVKDVGISELSRIKSDLSMGLRNFQIDAIQNSLDRLENRLRFLLGETDYGYLYTIIINSIVYKYIQNKINLLLARVRAILNKFLKK